MRLAGVPYALDAAAADGGTGKGNGSDVIRPQRKGHVGKLPTGKDGGCIKGVLYGAASARDGPGLVSFGPRSGPGQGQGRRGQRGSTVRRPGSTQLTAREPEAHGAD